MTDIFLVTPPFTQLNTPYPATAYLTGFLTTKNITSYQMDLGIEVILDLFSKEGLTEIFQEAKKRSSIVSKNARRIAALEGKYLQTIDPVVSFLQGRNQTFARQLTTENFLPRAKRFEQLDDLDWAFGNMGIQDKAKHLCTLYLEDLSDFIVECIDRDFGFSRYAERLGRSANSFDELHAKLQEAHSFIDLKMIKILRERLHENRATLICFSVPFPGNLYAAFRSAQWIKTNHPHVKIAMGGGFPNTELRSLTEVRVFDFFDYITLDDGELPIELLITHVKNGGSNSEGEFKRTYYADQGKVVYQNNSTRSDYKQNALGTPDYKGLPLENYISVIEIANPMHSLWTDGRWNKLTMAHGCYWGKCTFCDVSLDYIKLYEPIAAKILVDRMEELVAKTGENGFHFVDEAAPPALMRALALEIIKRKLIVTWWTNIRFEKSFSRDLCQLLKASGCIAVSGGLEVASDRLLALIQKGVTVEQVARVNRNFTEANIMVHAYLMYGYPTQTIQETIDSLEMVRQLFEIGILQSGFWHQFALTAHSPIGLAPEEYGISARKEVISFADNDVQFTDSTEIDHGIFSYGLKKSLFNYMHGVGFEMRLQDWFEPLPRGMRLPKTTIGKNYISTCLDSEKEVAPTEHSKLLWMGGWVQFGLKTISKKGKSKEVGELIIQGLDQTLIVRVDPQKGEWLREQLNAINPEQGFVSYAQFKNDYALHFDEFDAFWHSKTLYDLRENGLLLL